MGMNDSMGGYKKLKNTEGYTTRDLLTLMSNAEYSFGKPKMGTIAKKESIVFDPIGEVTVYVNASPKAIEISRVVTSGTGKFVLKQLAAALVTDAQSGDVAAADRAVDEVYEVVKGLLENGVVENHSSQKVGKTLYMRQKAASLTDKYDICTENQESVYWVEGNLAGLGFQIQDADGNLLLEIKKKLIAVMPEYSIVQNKKVIGKLKKKLKLTRPVITGEINKEEIELKGDTSGYHFALKIGESIVGSVDTVRFTWADCYEIKINNPEYQDVIVAIAIIVDNLLKAQD